MIIKIIFIYYSVLLNNIIRKVEEKMRRWWLETDDLFLPTQLTQDFETTR